MSGGRLVRSVPWVLCCGLLVSACGSTSSPSGGSSASSAACDPSGSIVSGTTASYALVVNIGPLEEMYSSDEVATKHPTSGEIMVNGAMSDAQGADAHHLEVHICSRSTGGVVRSANPTIMLTDTTTGRPAQAIPVAAMQGVTAGINDLHYGNNVVLPHSHMFVLVVGINGETATLNFSAP